MREREEKRKQIKKTLKVPQAIQLRRRRSIKVNFRFKLKG